MNIRRTDLFANIGGLCRLTIVLMSAIFVFPTAVAQSVSDDQAPSLGEGLFYFRVTSLPGQLTAMRAALAKHSALVIDLRGVSTNISAAQALRTALLPTSGKAKVARFVLINDATASVVLLALGGGLPGNNLPGVLMIAPSNAAVLADVKALGSAEEDKRACEAAANGTPLEKLINYQPDKPRYDEAVLVREHAGELPPEADAADANPVENPDSKKTAQERPLTDSVLQVAVQIHRALLALKKL